MARFFKDPPRSGSALALPGIAEGLRRLAYAVENLTVINGTVSWSARGAPIISMEGSDGATEDGAGLPSGGSQYQVLQRDGSGAAVWDWVRYKVPPTS